MIVVGLHLFLTLSLHQRDTRCKLFLICCGVNCGFKKDFHALHKRVVLYKFFYFYFCMPHLKTLGPFST